MKEDKKDKKNKSKRIENPPQTYPLIISDLKKLTIEKIKKKNEAKRETTKVRIYL